MLQLVVAVADGSKAKLVRTLTAAPAVSAPGLGNKFRATAVGPCRSLLRKALTAKHSKPQRSSPNEVNHGYGIGC
jgi:hypothetical protein